MPIVKIRERGQLTIPSDYRKELGLEENDIMTVVKAGDSLILTPKRLAGDRAAAKFQKAMSKKGVTLQNLLDNLQKQRAEYNKERYGSRSEN